MKAVIKMSVNCIQRNIMDRTRKTDYRTEEVGGLAFFLLMIWLALGCACSNPQLCDGSEGIRFYAHASGGGPQVWGSEVMAENGLAYFIVEGNCRFFAFEHSEGVAWTGTLNSAQETEVIDLFKLGEFSDLAGVYKFSACDAGSAVYAFGEHRVRVAPVCPGGPGINNESSVRFLRDGWSTMYERSRTIGTEYEGNVRYSVVLYDVFVPNDINHRNAPEWPIDTDIEKLAIVSSDLPEEYLYEKGTSHLATGKDAMALRRLRTAFYAGEIGFSDATNYIPIEQTNGKRYQLFLRDSIDLENEDGLISFE